MTFVVSAGALAQTVPRSQGHFPVAVNLADGLTEHYERVWRTQPQIRTVTSFLARNIAQLGLHVFRRTDDGRVRVRGGDHPLAALIERPSPWTTWYRFCDSLVNDLAIYDNAVTVKVGGGDRIRALQRLDPRHVRPVGGNPFTPDGYELLGARRKVLPADQVIHWRGYNPGDQTWGASPMETLRRILAEEFEAGRYRAQLWRNQARASGYLRRPIDAPPWSADGKERFRAQWHAQYSGAGPQAGGTPILEDGMEFVAAAQSSRDAQYIEARKLTREEVAAAYHIPLPMVGILDHATFSNIREQHKNLYQDCLGPWLQMIQQELALQLIPDLGDTAGLYVEFNLAEKLRGSFEERATQIQSSVGAPWMTRNEARTLDNLPVLAGGDELITPLNVLVGGQASPRDSAPPKTRPGRRVKARQDQFEARAERVFAGHFARQAAVVLAELGAATKSQRKATVGDVFDGDRWKADLAADLYPLDVAISSAAGRDALAKAGSGARFDEDRTRNWHLTVADGVSAAVVTVTAGHVAGALTEPDAASALSGLFGGYAATRAPQLARSQVTAMSGFGSTEAARQTDRGALKTWVVTSSNPRDAHAAMNGETVGIDDAFSNGAQWPGDSVLDEDDRAGCVCDVDIRFDSTEEAV